VIGSEGAGIRSEIAELLDVQLTIPIFNKIDSLNAGVAGSIVLYELNKKIIEYL
jgi:TrmH family RNA methyltransferase